MDRHVFISQRHARTRTWVNTALCVYHAPPRRLLAHDEQPGAYHVISRCVRRAWIRDFIRQAAGSFAVDVLAYAVMSNHLYIVVLTDPNRVVSWTPAEVATR